MNHYDVVIVGAGSMGMAAGYYLSKKGVNTLLIDSFDPPHDKGSHHGETRIIRHAYGEGREYVPLAIRAQELWYELEKESGEVLFEKTGVLGFGPVGSSFIDEAIASAEEYSLDLELLNGKEINERWKGIMVPEDYAGCYEPASGVLFSEKCISAYRKLAIENGAELLTNTPVVDIEIKKEGGLVYTKEQIYSASKLIICAGAWNGKLLSKLNIPLQPTRQTVAWFEGDETLYNSSQFPAYFVDTPEGKYYGFPSIDGCGVKIGRFDDYQPMDPDAKRLEFGEIEKDEGEVRRFLEKYMPQATGKLNKGRAGIFTRTPDEHFIIDQYPGFSHVIIAAGFSGHGFKFASVVGDILGQLAMNGESEHDLSLFSLKRAALKTFLEI